MSAVQTERIPVELRSRPQWVAWRYETRDDRQTKVLYVPGARQGVRAKTNDPSTWSSYDAAAASLSWADGIGYVFSENDPYTGVDLDDCRDPETGCLEQRAAAIVLALDSYTEASPSGTGVHVLVQATIKGEKRRKGAVEMYDRLRFFTIMGHQVHGEPGAIEERQAAIDALYAELFPPAPLVARSANGASPLPDDRDLLDRAMSAANGGRFSALWAGSWEGMYPSQSEADAALCSMLAFWTGGDAVRVDDLFRQSGLYRPKWERADYRERTINLAAHELRWGQNAVDAVGRSGAPSGATALLRSPIERSSSTPQQNMRAETALDADAVDAGAPFAMPLGEFLDKPREHVPAIAADGDGRPVIARKSLVMLGARGGQGKTTLTIDWLIHLALGVDYLCFTIPEPIRILVIENEGPEEQFAEKLRARVSQLDPEQQAQVGERIHVYTLDWGGFHLGEMMGRLVDYVEEHKFDLIFGDPLDALGIDGVGSPEDTRRFLALMKRAGLNSRNAWWLNTHPRKEETKAAIDEIAGAWGGKPDTIMLLDLLPDDRSRVRFPKIRWAKRGTRPNVLLAFDADTERFSYLCDEGDDERDYRAEMEELLADGKWRTVKELAAKTENGGIGAGEQTIKPILEQHPDAFRSCTEAEAVALGRRSNAVLWQLVEESEQ